MEYTYKKYQLSDVEKIWLNEMYKQNFIPINKKSLKVHLWNKFPENFDPKDIDRRFTNGRRLTLLGLWYIDSNNKMFGYVSEIILLIRKIIIEYPAIKEIKAIDIFNRTNIPFRDTEIAFELIYDLGGFFSSATHSNEKSGFNRVSFSDNDDAYDEFLKFTCLDDLLENYFIKNAPSPPSDKADYDKSLASYLKPKVQTPEPIVWDEIEKEYHISKRTFGKKINFVKDKYKRSIIFRDVEHAYILSKNEFYKPAVILAGGVIEELLRFYLKSKNIESKGEYFVNIIEACKNNNLFNKSTSSLSNSVRHFRNIVHLKNENNRKDTISKSAALGAVASIFTIVNDF